MASTLLPLAIDEDIQLLGEPNALADLEPARRRLTEAGSPQSPPWPWGCLPFGLDEKQLEGRSAHR